MDCSLPGSSVHGDSPGKNTRVGCHALLQEIFPTQGSNQGLEHCRQILYHLNHQGSPRILEYVAYTFSRGFSRPRNQTGISCTAGRFFTRWATRKAIGDQIIHHLVIEISLCGSQWNKCQGLTAHGSLLYTACWENLSTQSVKWSSVEREQVTGCQ